MQRDAKSCNVASQPSRSDVDKGLASIVAENEWVVVGPKFGDRLECNDDAEMMMMMMMMMINGVVRGQ